MKHSIPSKKAYHETMVAVYSLMNKGEANLTAKELKTLAAMAKAAEEYEDNVLGLKPPKEPKTLTEMLEEMAADALDQDIFDGVRQHHQTGKHPSGSAFTPKLSEMPIAKLKLRKAR